MAAIAGVAPQTFSANPSVFTLLEDCWHSTPVFNRAKVVFAPTEITSRKLTISSRAGELETEQRIRSAPTSVISSECSTSNPGVTGERYPSGSVAPRRVHSFDENEIRAVFAMLDKNCDGFICEAELRRFTSIWGLEMSKAEAQSMIRSLDGKRDGEIDFQAFFSLYQTSLEGHAMPMAMERTEEEDTELLSEAFRVFDRDNDGFISAQELQTVLVGLGIPAGRSLKQCQKMIENVDQDGNGKCDMHEFQIMMAAQPFLQTRNTSYRST